MDEHDFASGVSRWITVIFCKIVFGGVSVYPIGGPECGKGVVEVVERPAWFGMMGSGAEALIEAVHGGWLL